MTDRLFPFGSTCFDGKATTVERNTNINDMAPEINHRFSFVLSVHPCPGRVDSGGGSLPAGCPYVPWSKLLYVMVP